MENALDAEADHIRITFYKRGAEGFDFWYNGKGIDNKEIEKVAKCFELRERNEIYKTRSIGYRGEALNSMSKSSKLVLFTRETPDSEFGFRVAFTGDGEIEDIRENDVVFPKGTSGVAIRLRDVFCNNEDD